MIEPKPLLKISMMLCLIMTLISSSVLSQTSTRNLKLEVGELTAPKEPLRLDIQLPEPIEIKQNGITYYAFDIAGLAIIAEIFNGYTLWADDYIVESEQEALWQIRLDLCKRDRVLEKNNYELAINSRDHMYELWYTEQIDYKKEQVRNKVKLILISAGVGIIGVAAGIVIGFVAAQ